MTHTIMVLCGTSSFTSDLGTISLAFSSSGKSSTRETSSCTTDVLDSVDIWLVNSAKDVFFESPDTMKQ